MTGPDNTKTHTDIKSGGWIARFIPQTLRPYLILARVDRPIGWWLLLLPGWWAITLASGGVLSMNLSDAWIFALFFVGAIVMRGAGCVVNDLWDRRLDQKVERTKTRPLASGAVSMQQAFVFLLVLLCIGLAILLQMNVVTVLLGFLSLPLIIAYPLMKRFTWWPQLFLGLVFNFGALMGWSAVAYGMGLPSVLLYLGGIFWTVGYDTVYAHQDREDDLLAGVKSTALKFGAASKKLVAVCYSMALLLFFAALALGGQGWLALPLIVLPGLHAVWQLRHWDMNDPASSLRIFKSNRDFGLLMLLACAF